MGKATVPNVYPVAVKSATRPPHRGGHGFQQGLVTHLEITAVSLPKPSVASVRLLAPRKEPLSGDARTECITAARTSRTAQGKEGSGMNYRVVIINYA